MAAGLGTRLRPLTNTVPKCMIPIGDKPLLWYHVMGLKAAGITDIWINTHWLADQVTSYFGNGSDLGVHISYSHEPELLGTSGALKNSASGITAALSQQEFLVVYGDNFTNFNYAPFLDFHASRPDSIMTIAALPTDEPWTKGVIEVDAQSRIVRMVEKPPKDEVKSDLTNAGIYICTPPVLDAIPAGVSDFGFDIIPSLLSSGQNLYAYRMSEYLQDTGTPERYAKAQADASSLKFPFAVK